MKCFKVLIILFVFFAVNCVSYAGESMLDDIDIDFIEHAFDDIKPVTDKEFYETVDKLTPQPVEDTFKGKLKAFLFGRKYGSDTPSALLQQQMNIDIGGEKKAIEDIKNGVYYIKLLVSIVGAGGKIIPLGNYKIKEEIEDNQSLLVFYQGTQECGKLRLRSFEDEEKQDNAIAYSRVDIISEDVIRIVYSTIKDTKCALARVYAP